MAVRVAEFQAYLAEREIASVRERIGKDLTAEEAKDIEGFLRMISCVVIETTQDLEYFPDSSEEKGDE